VRLSYASRAEASNNSLLVLFLRTGLIGRRPPKVPLIRLYLNDETNQSIIDGLDKVAKNKKGMIKRSECAFSKAKNRFLLLWKDDYLIVQCDLQKVRSSPTSEIDLTWSSSMKCFTFDLLFLALDAGRPPLRKAILSLPYHVSESE